MPNTDNQVRATAKFVRMAPRKVRMVVDQIRNKSVEQALEPRTTTTCVPRTS